MAKSRIRPQVEFVLQSSPDETTMSYVKLSGRVPLDDKRKTIDKLQAKKKTHSHKTFMRIAYDS